MTFQITIIGLNSTGMDLGMALCAYPEKIEVLGCDREPGQMKNAKNWHAVHRTEGNLNSAVADADLIILNEPLGETLRTLETIAPVLDTHRYLFDVCPGKTAIQEKLKELAPDFRHHLSVHFTDNPQYIQNGINTDQQPRKDPFAGGLMMVAGGQGSSEEAVDLAITIAGMIKAKLIFSDSTEMDGLISSAVVLPLLNAAAMVNAVSSQPGWREARKLTGIEFFSSADTLPFLNGSADFLISNRENTQFWISQMSEQLEVLSNLLAEGNKAELEKWQSQAISTYLETARQRSSGEWEAIEKPDERPITLADRLSRLVGFKRKK